MRFFTPGPIAGWLYPDAVFRIKTRDKILYLTFDDGPDPGSTPQILEILQEHNVKAVFFCDGKAAESYPGLVEKIRSKGHLIGNHGYNHLNGWTTPLKDYCNDIFHASMFTSDKLFRPPYGYLRPDQYRLLKNSFKIVFWDVMPYDFDQEMEASESLRILNKKIRPGSVIVLHDRYFSTSKVFLDVFLERTVNNGYTFLHRELQEKS